MAIPKIRDENNNWVQIPIIKGKDGVVTEISGHYAFMIKEDGNLYVLYADDGVAPDFKIDDNGNLILTL